MQRAVLGLGRAAALPAVAGAGAVAHQRTSAPQNGRETTSPTRLHAEEHGEDGFVHIYEGPVQREEVTLALGSLATAGGLVAQRAPVSAAPVTVGRPFIEEIDAESDARSVDSDAINHLMASVDTVNPAFGAYQGYAPSYAASEAGSGDGASAFDLLADTVASVLNNGEVMDAIAAALAADPSFARLTRRVGPQLPPGAEVLLLEGLAEEPRSGGVATGNPLVDLLAGIQRGVGLAAVKVGEAFCHVGHFLRGIGEHLSQALAGMEGGAVMGGAAEGQRPARQLEKAVMKVAAAVAIVVLTRRVALARVVL